ncbi:MAG: hypothetical protein BWK80_43220, partial [Desulfobacteraceae bacterium IS3]
ANMGVSVSKTLSIIETGNAELKVTSHALSGANTGDFSVTPKTLTIADGGAAQNLTVQCTPGAPGARTATLTVSHNAAGSPATYTLNCTGKLPGDVNGDGMVNLADAVIALQIAVSKQPPTTVSLSGDVNSDGKIGTEEASFALKEAAESR